MKKHKIRRSGDRDIVFTGELIGSAETSPDTARSNYSGSNGRWQELELYRTQSSKLICQRMDRTQWQGERDHYEAKVCANEAEVIEFFGTGNLAKKLYEDAGIDCVEEVD